MTLQIPLSQIKALPFDFDAAVSEFIKAKLAHGLTKGEAAPTAPHPLVEMAVVRVPMDGVPDDFVAKYDVVDDSPPAAPPPTLDQKKQTLANRVMESANAEIERILPRLKRRLFELDQARISQAIFAAASPLDGETQDAFRARAIAAYATTNPADVAQFNDYAARLKSLDALNYRVAQLENEIHDLTDETVDSWKATEQ